jgi:hypothetical protein
MKTTNDEGAGLAPMDCSALDSAWKSINPILRGAMDYEDFKAGWVAAMRAIWGRMPADEFLDDATPHEMKLLNRFVVRNMPNVVITDPHWERVSQAQKGNEP